MSWTTVWCLCQQRRVSPAASMYLVVIAVSWCIDILLQLQPPYFAPLPLSPHQLKFFVCFFFPLTPFTNSHHALLSFVISCNSLLALGIIHLFLNHFLCFGCVLHPISFDLLVKQKDFLILLVKKAFLFDKPF